jgi:hypothetical protein
MMSSMTPLFDGRGRGPVRGHGGSDRALPRTNKWGADGQVTSSVGEPSTQFVEGNHDVFAIGWTLLQTLVPGTDVRHVGVINVQFEVAIQ